MGPGKTVHDGGGGGRQAGWEGKCLLPVLPATCPVLTFSLQAQGGILLIGKLTVAPLHKATQIVLVASIASP